MISLPRIRVFAVAATVLALGACAQDSTGPDAQFGAVHNVGNAPVWVDLDPVAGTSTVCPDEIAYDLATVELRYQWTGTPSTNYASFNLFNNGVKVGEAVGTVFTTDIDGNPVYDSGPIKVVIGTCGNVDGVGTHTFTANVMTKVKPKNGKSTVTFHTPNSTGYVWEVSGGA